MVICNTQSQTGWTLTEFILVITILSLVLCFSLPMLSNLRQNNQVQLIENDLLHSIQMAKIYARVSGEKVVLQPISKSKDWSNGIILMAESQSIARVINRVNWPASPIHVSWHGFRKRDALYFTSDLTHSAVNGYFLIQNKIHKTKLIINRIGRVRKEC